MSRILVHESQPTCEDGLALLEVEGHHVVVCDDRESFLSAMAERRPEAVVYVVDDFVLDVRVIALLRRVAPNLPIIVLSAPAGLEDRRRVQEQRPIYYGVLPLEPSELADAVKGALEHRGGGSVLS